MLGITITCKLWLIYLLKIIDRVLHYLLAPHANIYLLSFTCRHLGLRFRCLRPFGGTVNSCFAGLPEYTFCNNVLLFWHLFISEFPKEIHYSDSLIGKTQTRDLQMCTDHDPRTRFEWSFQTTHMYLFMYICLIYLYTYLVTFW